MNNKYDWSDPNDPPLLEAHSVAKHDVLEAYLRRYLEVLTKDPRIPKFKIHLIDGFCGGGLYRHEPTNNLLSGSPTLILKTVQTAEACINLERENKLSIIGNYYFVDQDKTALSFLQQHIKDSELATFLPNIKFINSDFVSCSDSIISDIVGNSNKPRAIFFLDQYGYSDVPFGNINKIFTSIPQAEVILTFATDWLIDYLGNNKQSETMLSRLELSGIDLNNLEDEKTHHGWRTLIEFTLSQSIHESSGAKFFTPFFIKTVKSNRSYWLIHLSNHARARDEMMQVHWSLNNQFVHHGGAGLDMLGYNPDFDDDFAGTSSLFEFGAIDRKRSLDALSIDLPKYIHTQDSSITFQELIDGTLNTSPASMEMFKEALMNLTIYDGFQIITPKNRERKSSSQISSDDRILRNPQGRLHFMTKKFPKPQ